MVFLEAYFSKSRGIFIYSRRTGLKVEQYEVSEKVFFEKFSSRKSVSVYVDHPVGGKREVALFPPGRERRGKGRGNLHREIVVVLLRRRLYLQKRKKKSTTYKNVFLQQL